MAEPPIDFNTNAAIIPLNRSAAKLGCERVSLYSRDSE